jgi:hypothetical protein
MTRFFVASITALLLVISSTAQAAQHLRRMLYQPKPAGPQITGALEIEKQSSSIPTYGGWIKFAVNVDVDGIPQQDGKLPHSTSKIIIQTICQQQDFRDTVDIREEYDGSGTYMFNLLDDEHNTGKDRPWEQYFLGLCQTKLLYQYHYEDINDAPSEMEYHLASTKVCNVAGTSGEHTDSSS